MRCQRDYGQSAKKQLVQFVLAFGSDQPNNRLVSCPGNNYAFVESEMAFRQGAAREHPPNWGCDGAATLPQGYFRLNPPGERGFWLRAAKIRNRKCIAISGTGH